MPFAIGYGILAAAQIKQGLDEAAVLRMNAGELRRQARLVRQVGQIEAQRTRRQATRTFESGVVEVGASGLVLEGSPLTALVEQNIQDDLEARTILFERDMEATALRRRAGILGRQGRAVTQAGFLRAGASILLGSSSGGGSGSTVL